MNSNMILNKVNFRGYEGYIVEGPRIRNRRDDLFYYELRHEDNDWSQPCTIEDFVWCNYWGTICFKESIDHLLEPWGTENQRLSTDLSEEEVDAMWFAASEGKNGEINHTAI